MSKALIAIFAVALLLIAGVVGFMIGDEDSSPDDPPTATTGTTGSTGATGTTDAIGDGPLNGLNLTAYTPEGYAGTKVQEDLERIKDLGSTAVTIVPTWYMAKANSNSIQPDPKKSPSDTSVESVIGYAKDIGLKVILKPHVDVSDETFRGDIQPGDRARWFGSYEDFIGYYADFATRVGADMFTVGTELKSLSGDTDPWRQVIEIVRGKYQGQLTYAANWDEVDQVQFWDSVDLIGVDAYYPLAREGQRPTEDDLVNAWQTPLNNLKSTSDRWGKPVLFTEIGYPTQADAAAHPFEVKEGEPADQAAQATAYRAAFTAFADAEWLRGMSWWSWRADPSPSEQLDIDYTPEDKEAEDVLAEAW
ncbi:MAG: cellulase family glycosylhydrolase [Actinomycetota bacterium]|nr:cellulase family glycosylhydrolase [Actinomycetota bacterium]